MLFKIPTSLQRICRTLAFRLTLWYAGIFSISSCAAFLLFYFLVSQTILNRMDQDLLDKAGLFSAVLSVQGIQGIKKIAVLESRAAGERKIFFRLLYPTGEVFASSYMDYWRNVKVEASAVKRLIKSQRFFFETITIEPDHQNVRVLYHLSAPNVVLQTGLSMDTYSSFLAAFKRMFAGAMTIVVILSAVCGWFMSRKALGGLEHVTRTAREISGASLSARVPESNNQDELNELAKTFNRMLDRIENLVRSIREMSDNIAHDLKSPITRIRGLAEITLLHDSSPEAYENMAASTIEEADRLLDMINTMLVISRTEAGVGGFQFETLDISALVAEACHLFVPVAEDSGIDFTFNLEPDLILNADRGMLQRAISNIIDNALKYTSSPGNVWVYARKTFDFESKSSDYQNKSSDCQNKSSVYQNKTSQFQKNSDNRQENFSASIPVTIEIGVLDTGVGIATEHLERVFERFYRADPSRNKRGTGLGLSFARTIAREHGGDLTLRSTSGQGSLFLLTLPYDNFQVI
ncbi:Sensory box histidine kinase [Desulfamplus magnetovallimortis]|uniref:histidine kinase n=1 Tax=Desulfamplus magnetovallimortis TaxID=1246637 RepID=A0A1W1HC68_9BACT|nr:ATP-binding protein [Desulfamplus magnetovallimortis]SLM30087.1 Sensory box histidine kinase [Desulfamplus magnetovallimortis]